MRINKFVALATGMGRRTADTVITAGRVQVNGRAPSVGQDIGATDTVTLDGTLLTVASQETTIILNKPVGYVVSRNGQGSRTIFDLLPPEYQRLKPVGRLDKDSSGLLLLTDNGRLANELTHPSHQKTKVYNVTLDKPLQPLHRQMISDMGVMLDDGISRLQLNRLSDDSNVSWIVTMHEGRNRQIRRTFKALGYTVRRLHRTTFGIYQLHDLEQGRYRNV